MSRNNRYSWNHVRFSHCILIKKPVASADKGRVIFTMSIVHMDPFLITNLYLKYKVISLNLTRAKILDQK